MEHKAAGIKEESSWSGFRAGCNITEQELISKKKNHKTKKKKKGTHHIGLMLPQKTSLCAHSLSVMSDSLIDLASLSCEILCVSDQPKCFFFSFSMSPDQSIVIIFSDLPPLFPLNFSVTTKFSNFCHLMTSPRNLTVFFSYYFDQILF